jgi:membrane-associated phospholipid phosphatase
LAVGRDVKSEATGPGPHEKLDAAVIAPRPTRRYRAAVFQAYALVASAAFVALAVAAHLVPYFRLDLTVARALQSYHGAAFAGLMYGISWIGFAPQVSVLGALAILALLIAGLRWEAVAALLAACGVAVGSLVKLIVVRPRPSADLIDVLADLTTKSFPSGHVVMITTFCGFLAFLGYTLLKPSWGRTALLVAFALLIALMGPSRIYLGQHWFSDVMGAYLLGSLWLVFTIMFYRWGKPRFFSHQPVAPEAPAPPAAERSHDDAALKPSH